MKEFRNQEAPEIRAHHDEDKPERRTISGYGIVFNSDSHPLPIWDSKRGVVEVVEQISQESMRDTDMTDIISAYNHNFEKVLGRTSSNTLKLQTDQKGVRYTVTLPDTSYANDVAVLLERGDVKGSSFVFSMDMEEGYTIEERSDGKLLAIPNKIKKVYEMGPVVKPAYPETTAENRSSHLAQAVERFYQMKDEAQKRTEEEVKKEEPKGPTEQRTEENTKTISYPNLSRYKAQVRLNNFKKRV